MPTTELVVLLDDDGQATGTDKAEVHGPTRPAPGVLRIPSTTPVGCSCRRALGKRTFPVSGRTRSAATRRPARRSRTRSPRAARDLGVDVTSLRLVLPRFAYRAEMDGVVGSSSARCTRGGRPDARPDLAEDEVEDAQWVGWADFSADVLAGSRDVSTWCREQVPRSVALGRTRGGGRSPTTASCHRPPDSDEVAQVRGSGAASWCRAPCVRRSSFISASNRWRRPPTSLLASPGLEPA